jgi:hypothetical protein
MKIKGAVAEAAQGFKGDGGGKSGQGSCGHGGTPAVHPCRGCWRRCQPAGLSDAGNQEERADEGGIQTRPWSEVEVGVPAPAGAVGGWWCERPVVVLHR